MAPDPHPAGSGTQKYKIKLASGRVLGPIDLERVRLLILKNKIAGSELAREYPQGEWVNISQIGPIADLLVARAQGALDKSSAIPARTPTASSGGTTRMLTPEEVGAAVPAAPATNPPPPPPSPPPEKVNNDDEATQFVDRSQHPKPSSISSDDEATAMVIRQPVAKPNERNEDFSQIQLEMIGAANRPGVAPSGEFSPDGATVMLEKPLNPESWSAQDAIRDPKRMPIYIQNKIRNTGDKIRGVAAAAAVGFIIYQLISSVETPSQNKDTAAWVPYRPTLPSVENIQVDPAKSVKLYGEAIRYYVQDTVPGYKGAADRLLLAIRANPQNVKADAMLASSYINLIDSSNKDENYFDVISKLIQLSRTKDIDLPETVISDVEFLLVTNKPTEAQSRIVDYTRTRPNFGQEMFYYLALAFYQRGDLASANRFISEYRADPFSAKVYYLRGQIEQGLGDADSAIREYERAIAMNPRHAKSRLAIAEVMAKQNRIQDAAAQLEFLTSGHYIPPKGSVILEKTNSDGSVDNRLLLGPQDLAQAYFLHSQLSQAKGNIDLASAQLQRAIRLDPENHDFLLEYYLLRAQHGERLSKIQPEARMYYFLGEGEKFIKKGDFHSALAQFLQAREQMPNATLPLVKIGDMFARAHDLLNARVNYKLAAEREPKNIEIWTKYITVLIQSYELQEAKLAMDRFRDLPVPQSAIDKAAADMYAKQGNQVQAQQMYRKSMSRDIIDPSVYLAYAKSLIATKNFKEAAFYFALAHRFDPLNAETVIGTAKCIAATDSPERAIGYLQDELQKGSFPSAELHAAIADFQIQSGAWAAAEQSVNQAIQADPDFAASYYLQAQIYLNHEGDQKDALDKALDSFNSYSDRNQSDPTGYLERYRIFVKKSMYEKASEELGKIFSLYPKYPNLHYYKGALYAVMGNHRAAIEEFNTEVKYNPSRVTTLVALGREYAQLGGYSEGLALFQKAMQLDPYSVDAKADAAEMNLHLKNYPAAIILYKAAIGVAKGSNPALYRKLADAYTQAGDSMGAAQARAKYLEMEPDAVDRN
jgi:tetratricopeptide (TPR) repeat protein